MIAHKDKQYFKDTDLVRIRNDTKKKLDTLRDLDDSLTSYDKIIVHISNFYLETKGMSPVNNTKL